MFLAEGCSASAFLTLAVLRVEIGFLIVILAGFFAVVFSAGVFFCGLNFFAGDQDFLVLPEILFSDMPSQAWLDWISPAFPNAAQSPPATQPKYQIHLQGPRRHHLVAEVLVL